MKNLLNNRMMLLGAVALATALAFSTQSANAQGFNNQPNRGGNVGSHSEPNRKGVQQHQPNHKQAIYHNALPSQHFGHQSHDPKKAEPAQFAQNHGPNHHNPTPVYVSAPCNHQPDPQVIVVGQPKKPNLFERIVNVFR